MGLDIVLGFVILSSAIRGWMRGFLLQGIRLAGLIGCVFAAAPVRDYVRPHVAPHLASIRPDLLDRMLWWAAAAATYVVTTGIAILAVKMYRKRSFGLEEPNRTDQFAGFLLGAIKGTVFACFIAAGLQRFAVDRAKGIDWAEEQARTSHALAWDTQFRPAEKIWTAPPVQKLLAHVRENGLQPPAGAVPNGDPAALDPGALLPEALKQVEPVAAGARPPRLDLPNPEEDAIKDEFKRILGELDRVRGR
jgi:uncharacterized membrane protein required for colicin V production